MSKLVFVADIDIKHSPKVRSEVRKDVITEYAVIYKKDKKKLPPIVLFTEDNNHYIVADGLHRLSAQISNGVKAVVAEVQRGGYEAALAFALVANERHGIRRSREDKRQCAQAAIKMWPTLSNAQIAERCAIDDHTVKSVRDEMEKNREVKPEPIREGSDGRKVASTQPRESSSEIREAPKAADPEKVVDGIGRAIPKYCIGYWRRAGEVKELLGNISHVMSELKKAHRNEDLMYAGLNITGILADLDKTWTTIQTAIPYVVCTHCHGHPEKQAKGECRMCRGKGLISKFMWDTAVPTELKQVLKNQKS